MIKADIRELPVYITTSNSKNKAMIAKVCLPMRFEKFTHCRQFVDPDTRTITVEFNNDGIGLRVMGQAQPKPLILITKALRMLHTDPNKMRGAVLRGVVYPDRVEIPIPDEYFMDQGKHGFEVLL